MIPNAHLGPSWYHSGPSDIHYSRNQFLALDFFCCIFCSNTVLIDLLISLKKNFHSTRWFFMQIEFEKSSWMNFIFWQKCGFYKLLCCGHDGKLWIEREKNSSGSQMLDMSGKLSIMNHNHFDPSLTF